MVDRVGMPGAAEVLFADKDALNAWARAELSWPAGKDVWSYVGPEVGRYKERFPRAWQAWQARAKPGSVRKTLARRGGVPHVVVVRRSEELHALYAGKYVSALPDEAVSSECVDVSRLRNLNADGSIHECWIFDDETMEVVGGWLDSFASATVGNRWYQKMRVLVSSTPAVNRGMERDCRPAGAMYATGGTVGRTNQLREYLASPATRREPTGLAMRANLGAKHGLVRELLSYVEAYDSRLTDELIAMYEAEPGLSAPMWITSDYQVM